MCVHVAQYGKFDAEFFVKISMKRFLLICSKQFNHFSKFGNQDEWVSVRSNFILGFLLRIRSFYRKIDEKIFFLKKYLHKNVFSIFAASIFNFSEPFCAEFYSIIYIGKITICGEV